MGRKPAGLTIPTRVGDTQEINYGKPPAPDFGPLARDRIPIRGLSADDLNALITIDRRITGRDRTEYFQRKVEEALHDSDVRVSLVAERGGQPVGFIMARVDLGSFGRMETTAIIDTLGVDPDDRDQGIGRALLSQLFANLATLRIERVRSVVDWQNRDLLAFLDHCGFAPSQELCFERPID